VNESLLKILVVHNYYQQSGGEYMVVKAQLALRQYGHPLIVYTKDNATINHFNFIDKLAFLYPTPFFPERFTMKS
jgi:hypothetical protein